MAVPFQKFWEAYQNKKKHPNTAHRLGTLRELLLAYELLEQDNLDELNEMKDALKDIRDVLTAEENQKSTFSKTGVEKYRDAIATLRGELAVEEERVKAAIEDRQKQEKQDLDARRQALAAGRTADADRIERAREAERQRQEAERLRLENERRENEARALAERQRKEATRNAFLRCKAGYNAEKSEYTLVRAKTLRVHKEPSTNPDGEYVVNGADEELHFEFDAVECDFETIQVKKGDSIYLEADEGDGGPPDVRSDKPITGPDADTIVALCTQALLFTRALCPNGTFNNAIDYDAAARVKVYKSPRNELRWRISKSETLRSLLQDPFKPLLKPVEGEESFLRAMAAMGKATFLSGGGVCAQLSHFTVGLLTMLAPKGTLIAIVYDKAIDHSYTIVAGPNTDWFVCDPWPVTPHVLPWRFCAFARRHILSHFLIRVTHPVDVPYGITFSTDHLKQAKQKADAEVNNERLPDKEWSHRENAQVHPGECLVVSWFKRGITEPVAIREKMRGVPQTHVFRTANGKRLPWLTPHIKVLLSNAAKVTAATWIDDRDWAATAQDWGDVVVQRWAE